MDTLKARIVMGETLIATKDCTLIASKSNPGIWYALTWSDGWKCSCPSYTYRGSCRHRAALHESFAGKRPEPIDESELFDDGEAPAKVSPAKRARLALVAGGAERRQPLPDVNADSHGFDDGEGPRSYAEFLEHKYQGRHE